MPTGNVTKMLELLTGIAGVGKTTFCLQTYRRALRESAEQGRIGDVVWITPTHRSAQAILQQLLSAELRCCWAPGVMTFEQFAERVLRGAGQPASQLNSAERRMLIKGVIQEAERAGELLHFRKVARTHGFTSQVGRFIAELKRDETWPADWQAALEQRSSSAKDQELSRLYDRYQARLLDWNKYDPEGRFWLARSVLADGNWRAFPRLSLVVVDGFTDFTRTQQEMLILLARHAQQMLLTLPGERGERRSDLFARSIQTGAMLLRDAQAAGVDCRERYFEKERDTESTEVEPAGLKVVRENLFSSPRQLKPAENAAGICCLTALGPRAEVREVGRKVKELLLQGVSAAEIGVTVRNLETYASLINAIWKDAGLPFLLDQGAQVTALPLARAVSALYKVVREDWSFAALKKLLRHTPLQLPEVAESNEAARAVLSSLRLLNLRGGKQEILESLQSQVLRETMEEEHTPEAEEPSALEQQEIAQVHQSNFRRALQTLQSLDQMLKPLARSATYSEQTQQLLATARELFSQPDSPRKNRASTSVDSFKDHQPYSWNEQWDLLAGLLREGASFQDRLASKPQEKVSWTVYADWIEEQFRFQSLPARKAETGEVLILAAGDARHLRKPYLFVMGLQEGSFPGRGDNQPFYSEQERVQWNQLGIPLTVRSSHFREEMQLFYQLVTQATHQLTLSYTRVNTKGAPQYACSFYQNLRSLFVSAILPEQPVGQLSPLPEQGDLFTQSDCRLMAVQQMTENVPDLLCWWGTQPERQESFWSLLAAVRMNAHRFEHSGFTAYEGLLQSAANQQFLHSRYHATYTFSASRLEAYATCPFRYFLEGVLGLEALSSPRLATDHRRRGNLLHDLLEELHQQDSQHLLSATDSQTAQLLTEKFLKLLTTRFERKFTRSELQTTLDLIEQRLLSEWSELYAGQTGEYLEKITEGWEVPPEPRYREIAFGSKGSPEVDATEVSLQTDLPAVRFGNEREPVFIEGRIDRIDVGQVQGQEVYTIIDYKTGKPQDVKEAQVSQGTQLQLALYAVAVVRLQLLGESAVPWQVGYWGLREQGFLPQFINKRKKTLEPLTADFLSYWGELLDQLLPRMVQAMRQGEFPVQNNDQQCMARCAFRTVCRISQVRSVAVPLDKIWNLLPPQQ